MNESRQCRSEKIDVGENGACLTKDDDPPGKKSELERHVMINQCSNQECDDWEEDYGTGKGRCGLEAPLSFCGRWDAEQRGAEARPGVTSADLTRKELAGGEARCQTFEKQIGEPPWTATLPE
jgi:hypothetical protein